MSSPAPSPASACWNPIGLPLIFPAGFLPFIDGILPCAWEQWASIGGILLLCCCCIFILMSGGGGGGGSKGGGGGAGGGGQVIVVK